MANGKLTDLQERFAQEYLVDLNATRAAERAGSKAENLRTAGSEFLANPNVSGRVAELMAERAARVQITQDIIVAELKKIALADIRRAVKWRANVTGMVHDPDTGEQRLAVTNEVALIGSEEIDDDTAGAIAEIAQTDRGGLKVKLHDKRAALVDLGKHIGMFREQVNVNVTGAMVALTGEMSAKDAAEAYRRMVEGGEK